jgi:hypothetical protein
MYWPVWIELHGATIVYLQMQSSTAADAFNGAQFGASYFEVVRWRSELDFINAGRGALNRSALECTARDVSIPAAGRIIFSNQRMSSTRA